jgi:hypothetical protein
MDQVECRAIAAGLERLADDLDAQADLLRPQLSASDLRMLRAVAGRLRDNSETIALLAIGEPCSQWLLLARSRASLSGCADDLCACDREVRKASLEQAGWAVPRIWDELCAFKRLLPLIR